MWRESGGPGRCTARNGWKVVLANHVPKLSVRCLRTFAHTFLAKNRPGARVFGHCPNKKDRLAFPDNKRRVLSGLLLQNKDGPLPRRGDALTLG